MSLNTQNLSKTPLESLIEAEKKAIQLFSEIEKRNLIQTGKSEEQLSQEIYELANEMFGTTRHWHTRIVRAGINTLLPYYENPPLLRLQEDDILFLDLGPIFQEWEADLGRTYVIGNNPKKLKLKNDVESIWNECRNWYLDKIENEIQVTGAELYQKATDLANQNGWEFGGEIAGHIVGQFPHEKLEQEDKTLYIHPENHSSMLSKDKDGNTRNFILEIHLVDRELGIGGFYEQLLTGSYQ
ncbi:M24 family metallopeptidase [Bernardetia sp. MNP-M8]|uniref:M24 family metallopeptidase n=1 Tax=Bernardetia sp. MNP-M8 TaxID=3127470 RepID=UPI0030CFBAAC